MCRSRSGLPADARESLQPRAVDGHRCPLAEHLDKCSNARLQGSTYACIDILLSGSNGHTMPFPIRRLHTPLSIDCLKCFFEPHFAAEAEILRSQRNERKKLEAERSALIAELEATLSPQAVLQVQAAMQRRSEIKLQPEAGSRLAPGDY